MLDAKVAGSPGVFLIPRSAVLFVRLVKGQSALMFSWTQYGVSIRIVDQRDLERLHDGEEHRPLRISSP